MPLVGPTPKIQRLGDGSHWRKAVRVLDLIIAHVSSDDPNINYIAHFERRRHVMANHLRLTVS